MRKMILGSKIKYFVIGIVITTFWTVFFFPLTIDGRYTCFFHRIFDHSHPVSNIDNGEKAHIHSEETKQPDNWNSLIADGSSNRRTENTTHGSVLLDKYLEQYAFVWWTSIGLLALCIYLVLRQKKIIKVNELNLTVKR
jgi:hypothetical protein